MSVFEIIKNFFEKLFSKNDIKQISEPQKEERIQNAEQERYEFLESLKKQSCEIETLVCHGDGLGIQKIFGSPV